MRPNWQSRRRGFVKCFPRLSLENIECLGSRVAAGHIWKTKKAFIKAVNKTSFWQLVRALILPNNTALFQDFRPIAEQVDLFAGPPEADGEDAPPLRVVPLRPHRPRHRQVPQQQQQPVSRLRLSRTRRRGSTTYGGCCPCGRCAAKYFPAGINQGLAAASAVPPVVCSLPW